MAACFPQERRADPAPPRDDRRRGSDLQAGDRFALRTRKSSHSDAAALHFGGRRPRLSGRPPGGGRASTRSVLQAIVEACERLANQGKRVLVAGLDKDYGERPSVRSPGSWRSRRTSPRRWRSASDAARPRTIRSGWSRATSWSSSARRASTKPDVAGVSSRPRRKPSVRRCHRGRETSFP